MLNKLRVAAEKEREQNEREYTKLFGSPIQYGSSVQVKVTAVFWQIISTLVVTCEVRQIHHNTSNTLLVLRKFQFMVKSFNDFISLNSIQMIASLKSCYKQNAQNNFNLGAE